MLLRIAKLLAESYVGHPYRGYGKINNFISKVVGERPANIQLGDCLFCLDIFDPYWNQLLSSRFKFEPEIEAFLLKELSSDSFFIDCGANYGYWTLRASSMIKNDTKIFAIEASPKTYSRLRHNLELNNRTIFSFNNAVTEQSGTKLKFSTVGKNHAGAAIEGMKSVRNSSFDVVESLCLADVIMQHGIKNHSVIKLDVEGAEIKAIQGLQELPLTQSFTVIYEEMDDSCPVSEYLVSETSVRWSVGKIELNGDITEVDINEARNLASSTRGPLNLCAKNILV